VQYAGAGAGVASLPWRLTVVPRRVAGLPSFRHIVPLETLAAPPLFVVEILHEAAVEIFLQAAARVNSCASHTLGICTMLSAQASALTSSCDSAREALSSRNSPARSWVM